MGVAGATQLVVAGDAEKPRPREKRAKDVDESEELPAVLPDDEVRDVLPAEPDSSG
jgi:hypothetical protein